MATAKKSLSGPSDLFADMTPDQLAANVRMPVSVQGSRMDFTTAPDALMVAPTTYQHRVIRIWEAYNLDPFFRELVNRFCDYAANGSRWEVSMPMEKGSWLKRLANWGKGEGESKAEREDAVWNKWYEAINQDVPGVLPGGNAITAWAVKHMILSGMFVPQWEYGDFSYRENPTGPLKKYWMPMRLTCHPASLITLVRENNDFVQETAYLKKSFALMRVRSEGQQDEAPERMSSPKALPNQSPLPIRWAGEDTRPIDEAFLLTY